MLPYISVLRILNLELIPIKHSGTYFWVIMIMIVLQKWGEVITEMSHNFFVSDVKWLVLSVLFMFSLCANTPSVHSLIC